MGAPKDYEQLTSDEVKAAYNSRLNGLERELLNARLDLAATLEPADATKDRVAELETLIGKLRSERDAVS